jgi:predicted glycosyltransferase
MQSPSILPRSKTVWIDWDNSPHVPFFRPIILRLEETGYSVQITARDCFQVCGLADLFKLKYERIGRHYGKNKAMKVLGNLYRALQLLPIAARAKPVAALSHGSRAMIIAARMLNIPTVEMTDYEFTQMIPFVHPALVIAPEVVKMDDVAKGKTRVAQYPGIKEDVYVPFFKPDGAIRNKLGLHDDMIVATIRPPATEAHYHNPESEILFSEVMNLLGALDNVKMVILPRNEIKQTAWIKKSWPQLLASRKAIIPDKVVDGLNLLWHSDLVVSGGGTMNREAAALGVPVYSIFRGKTGAVDRYLSENGRLCLLTSKCDVRTKVLVKKRTKSNDQKEAQSNALDAIMTAIFGLIKELSEKTPAFKDASSC